MSKMANSVYFLSVALLSLFAFACEKPDNSSLPDVITLAVAEASKFKVLCGGHVSDDGGKPVTEKGVLIGKTDNPSVDGERIPMGDGAGLFKQWIEDLASGTVYYFCAYAVNEIGTAYGAVKDIKTQDTITDIDGNIYAVVEIGDQTWMAENLKTSKYRNGNPIPNVPDTQEWFDMTSGAYCYFNNDQSNSLVYGKLYNWFALMDERGICPEGWEPPNIDDWMELIQFAGGMEVAGLNLKHKGFDFWEESSGFIAFPGGKDSFGFAALPGGYRTPNIFHGIKQFCAFWTSTEQHDGHMPNYILMNSGMNRAFVNMMFKSKGSSVRCIRKEN